MLSDILLGKRCENGLCKLQTDFSKILEKLLVARMGNFINASITFEAERLYSYVYVTYSDTVPNGMDNRKT